MTELLLIYYVVARGPIYDAGEGLSAWKSGASILIKVTAPSAKEAMTMVSDALPGYRGLSAWREPPEESMLQTFEISIKGPRR